MSCFEYSGVKICWVKHACFRIEAGGKIIYFDPYELPAGLPKADHIFVTHEHFDHCDPPSIEKLIKNTTVLVGPEVAKKCLDQFKGKVRQIVYVKPNQELTIDDIKVRTVYSYNISKFRAPGKVFHPKEDGRVGYVIEIAGVRIYHAGDTDDIPEMKELESKVDVALLPVSGTYVMTPEEAARAVDMIKPKVVIPMHYGVIVGDRSHAEKFKQLAQGKTQVVILEPEVK